MPRRASVAAGNWNDPATWGLINDTASLLIATIWASSTTLTTTAQASAVFNPGAITVAGFAVALASKNSGTNTLTLELHNGTIVVASATVNQVDLPTADTTNIQGGWAYFKFATPYTMATGNHTLRLRSSTNTNAPSFWTNGTAANWLRLCVTTATGAPAATDEMWIFSDNATGTRTVTFNETTVNPEDFAAATDYGVGATAQVHTSGAVSISHGGTLAFGNAASTNYTMRLSGNLVIFQGGLFTMGTSGARIPRTGTASLGLDNAANGDSTVVVRSGGVFRGYGESPTAGKNVVRSKLNGDVAVGVGTIPTVQDTGWLSGQRVVLTNTKRSTSPLDYEWEELILSANAGASSFTTTTNTLFAHSGVLPFRGDVALLTRNVRIRSVGSSFLGRLLVNAGSTFDIEWASVTFLGYTAGTTPALLFNNQPTLAYVRYCAFTDCPVGALVFSASSGSVITGTDMFTIDDNVFHNYGSTLQAAFVVNLNAQNTGTRCGTFNRNIVTGQAKVSGRYTHAVVAPAFQIESFIISGMGGGNGSAAVIYNSVVGASNVAQVLRPGMMHEFEVYGSHNVSGGTAGVVALVTAFQGGGSFKLTTWRTNQLALQCAAGRLDNGEVVAYGTSTGVLWPVNEAGTSHFRRIQVLSDGVNTPTAAITVAGGQYNITVDDLATATQGSFVSPTNDVRVNTVGESPTMDLVIRRADKAVTYSGFPSLVWPSQVASVSVQRDNNTDNSAYTQFAAGRASLDTTIFDGASGASMRVTPSNATYVVRVPIGRITVASGATRTVSLRALANAAYAGYGTIYPKLIARANPAVGLTVDTDIDAMAVAFLPGGANAGQWETLTGTLTATGGGNFTGTGQVELYVELLGTAGWVNFDTLTVS